MDFNVLTGIVCAAGCLLVIGIVSYAIFGLPLKRLKWQQIGDKLVIETMWVTAYMWEADGKWHTKIKCDITDVTLERSFINRSNAERWIKYRLERDRG